MSERTWVVMHKADASSSRRISITCIISCVVALLLDRRVMQLDEGFSAERLGERGARVGSKDVALGWSE